MTTSLDPYAAPAIDLDDIDRGIIDLLRGDGRMTFTEISKRLDIPEATARYRVQRLLQAQVIQVTAWPNPDKIGKPHVLFVYFMVENGKLEAIAEKLASMDEVRFVAVLIGKFNLVVDIYYGTHIDVLKFFEKVHKMDGIISYETQTVLKMLKAEYKYVIR